MNVPVFVSGDEVVREESVPDDWVEQAERARDAKRYLESELSGVDGFRGTARTNADQAIEGYKISEIIVYAEPNSRLAEEGVQDVIEGVPVSLRVEEEIIDTAYQQRYDPVKGGVHTSSTPSTTSGHTSTCRVNYNHDQCLMVPRHAYSGGRCSTTLIDTDCYQYGDHIGEIIDSWQKLDVAICECDGTSRNGVSDEIVAQSGRINGHVSNGGVEVLQSQNETVHKRGINTADTTGNIVDIDRSIQCDPPAQNLTEMIMASTPQQAGDSGGPVYVVDDSENPVKLFLVKLATQRQVGLPNHGKSLGVAAWHINNETRVSF